MKCCIFFVFGVVLVLMFVFVFVLFIGEVCVLVDKVVIDINQVIVLGKFINGMVCDFEGIFCCYVDVVWIVGLVLGFDVCCMSVFQWSQYVSVFIKYIFGKYGCCFNEFKGGEIVVQNVKQEKNYFRVEIIVDLSGQLFFVVDFLVFNCIGKNLFFDLIVEGISLCLLEKFEIGVMLDKCGGDLDVLIVDLCKFGQCRFVF